MATARPSFNNTQEYPVGDSKFPARLAQGQELPQLNPVKGSIGPYELIAELGSGGMGTVYVARRTYEVGVTRTVALKTLRQDLSSQKELVEMFLDEARITARISHPYVCSVMDIGTHRGVPYVTMDYIVGEPLSRLGPLMADDHSELSLANLVRVIASLCEGLHAAHELRDERGEPMHVVHRDISPDNLFVLYDGSVRVADFGIALTAAQQQTKPANLAGKSGYMSPEQLRGKTIDRRSDLWSMGVVLWELLAGKRLFRAGSDVAATVAILEGPIPPVSRFNSEVPKGLDAVIGKALERDRDKRYATARALAQDLDHVLARCFGSVSAGQVSTWLDALFPGGQDFRRTIVARAEEQRAHVDKFEFEPNLGILISTRPPANDQLDPNLLENVRRVDSLASIDVQLHESLPRESLPMQVSTNVDLIELAGFAQPPSPLHPNMRSVSERLRFPEPPKKPSLSLDSLPSPKRRLAQAAIVLSMLALGIGITSSFARTERVPVEIAQPAPRPEPVPAAPGAAAQAPVAAQPVLTEAAKDVVATPSVEPALEPARGASAELPAPEAKPQTKPAGPSPAMPPALVARRHRTPAADEDGASPAAPAKKVGEVYVFASTGHYEVLQGSRAVQAPALLKLAIGTEDITVRNIDDGRTHQVKVNPQAGRPMMVRIDP